MINNQGILKFFILIEKASDQYEKLGLMQTSLLIPRPENLQRNAVEHLGCGLVRVAVGSIA